jgi:predicted metal-dependent phosphoesterase TrpH
MILDMHVHSTLGEGGHARPSEYAKRVNYLRENGYDVDGFVLTEHNKFGKNGFHEEFKSKYDVTVFSGVEVTTNLGHILVFGVKDNSFRRSHYLDSQKLIDWANNHNCVAVPAHPFSINTRSKWSTELARIRGVYVIEGLNGALSIEENKNALDYAKQNKLRTIGGSDAHRLRQFGRCLTEFSVEIATIDDLLDALAHAKYAPIYLEDARKKD